MINKQQTAGIILTLVGFSIAFLPQIRDLIIQPPEEKTSISRAAVDDDIEQTPMVDVAPAIEPQPATAVVQTVAPPPEASLGVATPATEPEYKPEAATVAVAEIAVVPDAVAAVPGKTVTLPIVPDPDATVSTNVPTLSPATEYLLDRALREAEASAQRAAHRFMQDMLKPIRVDGSNFAESLYSIGSTAQAVAKSETAYREYVARRFQEELAKRMDIRESLEASIFEFSHRLERIATQVVIESGLDVKDLPTVRLEMGNFENILSEDLKASLGELTQGIQQQAREGATIETLSIGISLFLPTPFFIDVAIGQAVSELAEMFRDPEGHVEIVAHRAAEQLADRICFGTDRHGGLYAGLLDVAHFQNRQLRKLLITAEPVDNVDSVDDEKNLDTVFGGKNE
ncbi:MAG TPA: hypothetical protein DCS43_11360 [Verrucomicrobia bacterium]|nr:hypothetical protein [Verrucomicrobiota bacterium]